ncbi:type II secretion system protein GspK [Bradyrhizobium sp.]|uniref:type II secretion system protein GspK n=1 Tax=Bradyrhizobium sp. TaxID=376 RepID=UPI001DBF7519|nr:type II secretion system protein GspK [Bradyrhizobium sp.]MBI5321177.1 general secretion pathway protein GspK [Bradyrhizobium sp.]
MLDVRTSSRDRGFALLIVLWALLLLSVLGSSFLAEARAVRTVANTATNQLAARMLADGAINRIILSLLDPRDPLRLPLDGTLREIALLKHQFTVSCQSEAGKVDLNTASPQLLMSLLTAAGLSREEADALAQQISIWRSPLRNSADESAVNIYRDAGRSYGPRFGMFRSVGELRLVIGMNDSLQERIAPFLTVWSNAGAVDLSVAGDDLLELLAAQNDNLASMQLAARKKGNSAGATRTAALGEVLTVTAVAETSGVTVTRKASIQIAGDRNQPYRVLAWQ